MASAEATSRGAFSWTLLSALGSRLKTLQKPKALRKELPDDLIRPVAICDTQSGQQRTSGSLHAVEPLLVDSSSSINVEAARSTTPTPATATSSVAVAPLNLDVKFIDSRWDERYQSWMYNDTANPEIPAELVQPVGTEAEGSDCREKYCFVVVRKYSRDLVPTINFEIVLKSPYLITACKNVMADVPGVSWNSEPIRLDPKTLIAVFPRLVSYEQTLSSRTDRTEDDDCVLKSLGVLLAHMRNHYKETLARVATLVKNHEITFDLLYTILLPGTVIIQRCPVTREAQALKLLTASLRFSGVQKYWSLRCEYLQYVTSEDRDTEQNTGWGDNTAQPARFGMLGAHAHIYEFDGVEKINTLSAYPMEFHPDPAALKVMLIERARKWVSLCGMHHMHYWGNAGRHLDVQELTVETFPTLATLLRMSKRYQIERPCQDIVARIRAEWPAALAQHDAKEAKLSAGRKKVLGQPGGDVKPQPNIVENHLILQPRVVNPVPPQMPPMQNYGMQVVRNQNQPRLMPPSQMQNFGLQAAGNQNLRDLEVWLCNAAMGGAGRSGGGNVYHPPPHPMANAIAGPSNAAARAPAPAAPPAAPAPPVALPPPALGAANYDEDLIVHPASVIGLLRECGYADPQLLFPLFYALSRTTWQFGGPALGHHLAPLSAANMERLVVGIERIREHHTAFAITVPTLDPSPHGIQFSPAQCQDGIKQFWQGFGSTLLLPAAGRGLAREPLEDLAQLAPTVAAQVARHRVCATCGRALTAKIEAFRRELWGRLPQFFELA
ncbi:hypothetical protein GSI_08973 [Ganoderma sinense ZZ0214-1]|uniref:DUF7025 domain-containing protein n=1 Tax=Ganoderma sinense ZZ0214-1 TaxID=1077348 RepID=A0A2G8S569_9APHY|nr:hypothetical protein GSI_08973 [Ganoderma sinense ZZ0214-1]